MTMAKLSKEEKAANKLWKKVEKATKARDKAVDKWYALDKKRTRRLK